MKVNQLATAAAAAAAFAAHGAAAYTHEKLNANDSVLLIVDHQTGLFGGVRDQDPTNFKKHILGHAELGKLFNLPVVITTSAADGPQGPTLKEVTAIHPDAPYIPRNGEIDAWENAEFREAVYATNKTQVILAGINTEVCTAFLALSLREAGFSVWANADASGTTSVLSRDLANLRMHDAGIKVISQWAIASYLFRDWRNPDVAPEDVMAYVAKYFPESGIIQEGWEYAKGNGTDA